MWKNNDIDVLSKNAEALDIHWLLLSYIITVYHMWLLYLMECEWKAAFKLIWNQKYSMMKLLYLLWKP